MTDDKIRDVLRAAAHEPNTRQVLREDPEKLRERFALSADEITALERAAILVLGIVPAGTTITTSPITITVTTHRPDFLSGDPPFRFPLEEMEQELLARMLLKSLSDEAYAARLREQLEL